MRRILPLFICQLFMHTGLVFGSTITVTVPGTAGPWGQSLNPRLSEPSQSVPSESCPWGNDCHRPRLEEGVRSSPVNVATPEICSPRGTP